MSNQVSDLDKKAFRMAFEFYAAHNDPPDNTEPDAVKWWQAAGRDISPLYDQWKEHTLGSRLLMAVFETIEEMSREKMKEVNDFVQE